MPTRIKASERAVIYVPAGNIKPNPWNRTVFDPVALEELAKSIRSEGIREPLILRQLGDRHQHRPQDVRYEIASGNRRWLAAQKIGLEKLPCLIETLSDEQVAEDNIVMNIQREDIPPLELARMVQTYMKTFKKKQKDAARTFGKSKQWVSQLLGFLEMAPPEAIKKYRALDLRWDALQAIKSLGTDLAAIIAKELEDGSLTPRRIIKRCNQILYGRHHTKGGFTKDAPPPADPFKQEWIKASDAIQKNYTTVWWEVEYGSRKHPGGVSMEGWHFFAAPTPGVERREALAKWFTQMGKILSGQEIQEENPYLEAAKASQVEKDIVSDFARAPKNAKEKAELLHLSRTQGPRAVYRWIYGKDFPVEQAIPVDTWESMNTTPEAGVENILRSLV